MSYDSTQDTKDHIREVQRKLYEVINDLHVRAGRHDRSKLEEPEKSAYDEFTPKLYKLTYGSDEYKACTAAMGPALEHHYAHNDHHPEHFENGIKDMDLVQIIEMLCDWKAATMRHADGDLRKSILLNAERFGYGDEMTQLLLNTASRFGWL